jgi:hypothetical protein
VARVPAHLGEMAMPGEVLLALTNQDNLKLTLYVRNRRPVQTWVKR